ncbi:MAG: tRNA lysidine(34) synthetase TilS, partial [Hydrogenophilaceae bacterium]|nr:tRNA lysidine(34) synthetase TilS [Hydrogenophilaceae bacterium]
MAAVRHALPDAPALDRRALAALTGPVVLGFSGGGDSTALLRRLSGLERLTAIIVDHALRPGSQEDAARAARFAEALGVPARIVTLAWPPGAKRTQAALRRARHVALYEAARSVGASVVALAHTADDQAETVMMRAARVGWRRAAGMAPLSPAPIWPEGRGIVIARPLLDVRRKALRAWLTAQGAEWIEDPANENAAFERVRVRRRLAEASDGEVMRLVRLAAGLRVR